MEFCLNCENLLSLQITDGELREVCKVCEFSRKYDLDKKPCIFEKKFNQNSFLSEKYTNNPFICLDKSLPRISSMQCKNPKCITNQSEDSFQWFIIRDIPIDLYEPIIERLQSFATETQDSLAIRIEKKVTYEQILLQINKSDIDEDTLTESMLELEEAIRTYLETVKELPKETKQLWKIERYEKPDNEVVFIKYDHVNMKYVYICCHCNYSWEN